MTCNSTVTYTLSVMNSSSVPVYISSQLTSSPRYVAVYSTKRSDVSNITVMISGSVTNFNQSVVNSSIQIPILLVTVNTAPPTYSTTPSDITVKMNTKVSLTFPSYSDPDNFDKPSVQPGYPQFGSASVFVTGNYPQYWLSPTV